MGGKRQWSLLPDCHADPLGMLCDPAWLALVVVTVTRGTFLEAPPQLRTARRATRHPAVSLHYTMSTRCSYNPRYWYLHRQGSDLVRSATWFDSDLRNVCLYLPWYSRPGPLHHRAATPGYFNFHSRQRNSCTHAFVKTDNNHFFENVIKKIICISRPVAEPVPP